MNSEDLHSYVHKESLLEALRDLTGRSDVELEDEIEVKRATKGVEGFLSLVLRIRVPYRLGDGTTHSAVLILKCMPKEGVQLEMVKTTGAFTREGIFFDKVYPLLRRASAGKVTLPMPMCYHTKYGGDDDAFYIEDLCARGFRTPAASYRTQGLDMEHCRLVMEAYGRLHALTIAAERLLPKEKGKWSEAFPVLANDPIFFSPGPGKPPVPYKGMVDEAIEMVIYIAKRLDGLPKEAEASGKLRSTLENRGIILKKMILAEDKNKKVLTHGDCWMNNSMIRYENVGEESRPVEMKLLDFQICRYCHPCVDIISIMYLSIRKSLRVKHMHSLIQIYYDSLERNLRTLNYGLPPLTLEEFLNDFHRKYEGFGFMTESLFLPIMLLGEDLAPSNAEDFTQDKYDEFFTRGNSSSVRSQYAKDPNYRSIIDEAVRDLASSMFPNGINAPIASMYLP